MVEDDLENGSSRTLIIASANLAGHLRGYNVLRLPDWAKLIV